jgi:hypothetical protein
MARPQRNNVDYFPFYCEDGNKMFYLEETYGNDGFAVFVKLLRELAKVDYHYLNLSKPASMMFLSAKCKVSKEVLEAIINDLVMLEKFDSELWTENKIIWCQDFIDSIQDAYVKRSNNCIDKNGLLSLLVSLGIRKPLKGNRKPSKQPTDSPVKPQSIVKDSIINKIKEENKRKIFIRWIDYRIELKKPIKVESTLDLLVKKFNDNSVSICEKVINSSIENNYTGLFWEKFIDKPGTKREIPKDSTPRHSGLAF